MGTYTFLDCSCGPSRHLGQSSSGGLVCLSRTCQRMDPSASLLCSWTSWPQAHSSEFAGLVEVGEADGWIWMVEAVRPAFFLSKLPRHFSPNLACYLALRLSQSCASLASPHLRLSPRSILLSPNDDLQILGNRWARLLPVPMDDLAYVPEPPLEDARADAFAAAEIARLFFPDESSWTALALPLREALEKSGAGPRRTWMLHPNELAEALERALGAQVILQCRQQLSAFIPPPTLPQKTAAKPLSLLPLTPNDSDESAWVASARSIERDGRLSRPATSSPSSSPGAFPIHRAAEPSTLELDEKALAHARNSTAAPSASDGQPAAPRNHRIGLRPILFFVVAILAVLGVVLGTGLLPTPAPLSGAKKLLGRKSAPILSIESTPEGASVRIGDMALGTTPYFGDNDFPEGEHSLSVEKPGFEPAVLKFSGGQPTRLKVRLIPRRRIGGDR